VALVEREVRVGGGGQSKVGWRGSPISRDFACAARASVQDRAFRVPEVQSRAVAPSLTQVGPVRGEQRNAYSSQANRCRPQHSGKEREQSGKCTTPFPMTFPPLPLWLRSGSRWTGCDFQLSIARAVISTFAPDEAPGMQGGVFTEKVRARAHTTFKISPSLRVPPALWGIRWFALYGPLCRRSFFPTSPHPNSGNFFLLL